MPILPDKISGFRSKPINDLIDFCRSLVPIPTHTVKHDWTVSGVASHAKTGNNNPYTEDVLSHFQVEMASATSVKVHGGRVNRKSGSHSFPVLLTIDGGGTSGLYADVKTLTSITSSGWIIIQLNGAVHPTTLVASYTGTAPTEDGDPQDKVRYLAKITCASSVITAIEPMHTGDIEMQFVLPDSQADSPGSYSIGYEASDHTAELYLFKTAASGAAIGATDDVCVRSAAVDGVRTLYYATISALASVLVTTQVFIDYITNLIGDLIVNYFGGAWGDVKLHDHGDVTWHSGLTDDDHTQYVSLAGAAERNKFAADAVLADNTGVGTIFPSQRLVYDVNGDQVFDWATAKTFTVNAVSKGVVANSTASTSATTGALTVSGGIGATSAYITKITAGASGFWHTTNEGKTNTGITSGGIVTGTLVKIAASELLPTDEVVVWRA